MQDMKSSDNQCQIMGLKEGKINTVHNIFSSVNAIIESLKYSNLFVVDQKN